MKWTDPRLAVPITPRAPADVMPLTSLAEVRAEREKRRAQRYVFEYVVSRVPVTDLQVALAAARQATRRYVAERPGLRIPDRDVDDIAEVATLAAINELLPPSRRESPA